MGVKPIDGHSGCFNTAFAVHLKVSSAEDLIFGWDFVFHRTVDALAMLLVIHQLFLLGNDDENGDPQPARKVDGTIFRDSGQIWRASEARDFIDTLRYRVSLCTGALSGQFGRLVVFINPTSIHRGDVTNDALETLVMRRR